MNYLQEKTKMKYKSFKGQSDLPTTVWPEANAHIQAHSAGTVKLAKPHWDSPY